MDLTVNIDDSHIIELIKQEVDKRIKDDLTGITWSFDEFRKNCCGGKARAWVELFVINQFKDEITDWYVPSSGRGTKIIIFAKPAKEWMELNRNRIDWKARLPK